MRCAVVMPVYNEAAHLDQVIQSFVNQTQPPDQLILVDDGSTDDSLAIMNKWCKKHLWIQVIPAQKPTVHEPGAKVIQAFYRGHAQIEPDMDLIGKFDADIILPDNYIERLKEVFQMDPKLGLASGLLYLKKNDQWVYEGLAKTDKVRGPIKLYRSSCFEEIGGLLPCLGWDSIDQWLSLYHGWRVQTLIDLKVKHLKATGQAYSAGTLKNQGMAFAHMGYGFILTFLSLAKLAGHHKRPKILFFGLVTYWKNRMEIKVSPPAAKFIKKQLWSGMLNNR